MTQYSIPDLSTPLSGAGLASILNQFRAAMHSNHKGSTAPSYAITGTAWIDDSLSPVLSLKVYSGSAWITQVSVNISTGLILPGGLYCFDESICFI